MALSIDPADRQTALGDLVEEFDARVRANGVKNARRWYRRQVRRSLIVNIRGRLDRRVAPRVSPHRKRGHPMRTWWQDVRYSYRSLRHSPFVTAVALGSLVVGLALSVTVFSLYDAVALRPLAVARPNDLVVLLENRGAEINRGFSYLDLTEFQSATRLVSHVSAFSQLRVAMGQTSGSEVIAGEVVSANYFEALGVRMEFGRGLTDADERASAPVVVLADKLWRHAFPSASRLDGQTVTLNRKVFTVIGVLAPPFAGLDPAREAQFWTLLKEQRDLAGSNENLLAPTAGNWLRVFGRVRPGTNSALAAADFSRVEATLDRTPNRPQLRTLTVVAGGRGDSSLSGTLTAPLELLLGVSGLLLLIACANVAGLLMARADDRSPEMAIRTALGATRGRLLRLIALDAALIGGVAVAISLGVSRGLSTQALPMLSSTGAPPAVDVSVDWRITAFAAGIGLIAVVVSIAPAALRLVRSGPASSSLETARTVSPSRRRARFRQALVVAQFAMSFAVLVVAGLLGRTLMNLRAISTGFDIDRIALVSVDLTQASYDQPRARQYFEAAVRQIVALPGVQTVGVGRVLPLAGGGSRTGIAIPGYTPRPGESLETNYNSVSSTYFAAMGITLVAGRVFDDATDVPAGRRVALVNQAMARRFWGGERAVGRTFSLGDRSEVTIVGIVADVKYRGLREELPASFYLSTGQIAPLAATFHVRTAKAPSALLDELHRAIAAVDPEVPITRQRTLRQQADLGLADERVSTVIGVTTGGAATLLAAVGLFAMLSYAVGRRTRELGVRIALGASSRRVGRMLVRQAAGVVMIGSLAGTGLGALLGRLVQARLYGVTPFDLPSVAAAAVLLGAVSVLASWWPARRATRIDPVIALRG
jgi:predicted permease